MPKIILNIVFILLFLSASSLVSGTLAQAYASDQTDKNTTEDGNATKNMPRITIKQHSDETFKPDEVDDAMIRAYIEASRQVNTVKGRMTYELQQSTSKEERAETYKKLRDEMASTIEKAGDITFEDYEKLSKTAQHYPEIFERIIKAYHEHN